MTDSERITALEQELAQFRGAFREYGAIHQYDIGESEAYRAAVTALIATHPNPDLLMVQLEQHVARPEAQAVFHANNEERLQGLQAAQTYLLEICDIAQRLHRTTN